MVVVITPDLSPMINKFSDRKELVAVLNEFKAENVVTVTMCTGDFMLECMSRGLNDYRKDLVTYD